MMNKSKALMLALAVMLVAACSDSEDPGAPGQNTRVEVVSDPAGASIEINGQNTGQTTPHTFFDLSGDIDFRVVTRQDNIDYGFVAQNVRIAGDSLHRVLGPLITTCSNTTCLLSSARTRDLGRMRISTQATGPILMKMGQGEGLLWPLGSSNSYVSMGLPLIAMLSGATDSLALGIYDWHYLAGRPAPVFGPMAGRATLRQSFWIKPLNILSSRPTVRGIEVDEQVMESADSNVILIRLTFRNITNRDSYRAVDPLVPGGGMRFDHVYVGFGIDSDIGTAGDDMLTYEPELNLVYSYDSNFLEDVFNAVNAPRPGLIGLRLLAAPSGTVKVLNGWPLINDAGARDWVAGTASEGVGYGVLSGLRSFTPDRPGQQVGHAPQAPADYRMSVSAGPLTLAPGDSASITVALIMAAPETGEYVSGQVVPPGDPDDPNRQIRRVARVLLERARALGN